MPGEQGPLDQILPDWPSGPLDFYRKTASFDWKALKVLIESEDCIRYKAKVWNTLVKDPIFGRNPWDEIERLDSRRITFLRMKRLIEYEFVTEDEFLRNPLVASAVGQIIGQYDWSLCSKKFLAFEYFISNARSMGSQAQNKFMEDVYNFKALGCISITELAHGSNTKGLQTRATYDPVTNHFIFNTPNLEATKVWSGVMGQTATHASVFAQLYTQDGVCHGLHTFLVPIRDPKSLLPFKGLKIGDMGPKLGLNSLDNGFVIFDNYPVERSKLLSKNVILTKDGKYSLKSNKRKPQEITLGILSLGRVTIILQCITNMQTALVIAVRYAGVRKQFSNKTSVNGEQINELNIIEYQTHQWRLFPYVAASYVLILFYYSFFDEYINFFITNAVAYGANSEENQPELGEEIHALSCAGKACTGWLARDAIQESREACGGYGYLKASRFGELRDDHDPNNTYEGDNNVILQQTSNYIIKKLEEKLNFKRTKLESPLGSLNFLDNYEQILREKSSNLNLNKRFSIDTFNIGHALSMYQHLVCYLCKQSLNKLHKQLKIYNNDLFYAKNNTNVFYLRTLSIVYFDCEVVRRFKNYLISIQNQNKSIIILFEQLGLLYALYRLEPRLSLLYESGYFIAEHQQMLTIIKEKILSLCNLLKGEMVSLVDVFSPPDFILNSSLGYSDGKIYEHIFEAISKHLHAFDRPNWYKEFTEKKPILNNSKL